MLSLFSEGRMWVAWVLQRLKHLSNCRRSVPFCPESSQLGINSMRQWRNPLQRVKVTRCERHKKEFIKALAGEPPPQTPGLSTEFCLSALPRWPTAGAGPPPPVLLETAVVANYRCVFCLLEGHEVPSQVECDRVYRMGKLTPPS